MLDTIDINLAIVGSRDFNDFRMMCRELDPYTHSVSMVISGGAVGADHLAEKWARKNGIPTKIFLPDHKQYRHPYHHRNRLIVEACDALVAFWNGSSGTRYTINYAKKMGKPVKIIRF